MKFQSSIVALTLALAALAATGSAARISMSSVASYWKRAGGSTSSCPTAVAVAWAESRGDTTAKGYNSNSIDRGLWQINNYWHRDVSDSCAFDAGCNARAALRISSGGSRAMARASPRTALGGGGARAAVSLQSGRAVETRRRHSHLQPSRAVWQGQERDQKAGPAGGSAPHWC